MEGQKLEMAGFALWSRNNQPPGLSRASSDILLPFYPITPITITAGTGHRVASDFLLLTDSGFCDDFKLSGKKKKVPVREIFPSLSITDLFFLCKPTLYPTATNGE